ncbi:hypothetical protein BDA99DRAFT_570608 [Phascolomyces articulosus]|uniref:GAR domain-containing protein n=1 Tax=Phascolomyces articulosus TaxID=60185 RepID=A0AAD5KIF8_9FUNG|nr:hypothetical protein BDA99DRAFT_570608 [Phascolomyces articulosus]
MTQDAHSSIIDLRQQRDIDEKTCSVQAWLQMHLDNYVELNLLPSVPEKVDASWIGDGTSLLCLAHRFCPSALPDLLEPLRNESTNKISLATHIFQNQLNVSVPTNDDLHDKEAVTVYLSTLKQVIDQLEPSTVTTEQTLRMTQVNMVSERQWVQVTRRTRENTVEDDEFERQATLVLNKISQLRNQLNDMTLLTSMAAAGTVTTTSRPMDDDNNDDNKDEFSTFQKSNNNNTNDIMDGENNNNDDLAASVQQFESALETFKQGELADIHAYIREMSDDARTSIYTRIQAIDAAHAALEAQLQEDFRAIRMGVQFAQLTTPIRNELEFIQAKMLKTATTEEGIRDLEDRTHRVKEMIIDIEEKHGLLLGNTTNNNNNMDSGGDTDNEAGQQRTYRVHFDTLKQKHRLVSSWVDEVRVWFIEAERIRRWIEERIEAIDSEPVQDAVQTEELSEYTIAMVDALNAKHETMEKEVEQLNKEDMTRLRSYVKTLTGSEKQDDKDLSPADTTTIEITFTTLMTLDKLMHLLRRRSYDLQMLTLRLFWEQEYNKAYGWVSETNVEVDGLLQQARWQQDEEKGTDRNEAETLKNMTVHLLLDIEQRASEFDQGQFTTAVNMYQEMDDTSKVELPPHLESRQVDLEEAFEALTKRLSYVRQVVEQRLTVVDFVYRADELMGSGEQLREEITLAEQQVTDADSDRDFTEQIRYFQEQAVQLVTSVAARIRYPENAYPITETAENNKVNDTVRAAMSARKSVLILLGEGLDHKLQSYKRVLELQKSATHLHDDMHQLEDTVEKQIKSVQEAKVDVFVAKCTLYEPQLLQLQKERDDQLTKAGALKNTDWKILKDCLDGLKQDVDSAGAVAVKTGVLYDSMEKMYKRIGVLESVLSGHTADLDALKKRIQWETEHESAMRSISSTLHSVWDIIRQIQWQPDMDDLLTQDALTKLFNLLQREVNQFEKQRSIQFAKTSFNSMMIDLSKLLLNDGDDTLQTTNIPLPGHFQQRQDALEQSVQDLKGSIDFAHLVHDQHAALIRFMDHAATTHQLGQQLSDALENAIKHVMTDKEPHQFDNDVQQFDKTLQKWWANYGLFIPYPICSINARVSHSSTSDDHAVNKDIEGVVKTQRVELEELGTQLKSLVDKCNTASNLKQLVVDTCGEVKQQQHEVEEVLATITSNRQNLSIDSMDLDAMPDMDGLKTTNQDIQQKVEEAVVTLDRLRERSKELDQSIHDSNCHPEVSVMMVNDALESLAAGLEKLKSVSAMHTQELDVSSVRVEWERQYQNAAQEAETVQGQLRQLVDCKNALTPVNAAQQELASLKSQAESIQQNVVTLSNDALAPTQASYDRLTSAYASASIGIPHGIIERQSDIKGLFSRLSDTVEQTKLELDYLIQRSSWEHDVNKATESCAQQEQKVEDFIQRRARWSMEDASTRPAPADNDTWNVMSELERQVTRAIENMTALAQQGQGLLDQHMEETQDTLIRRKNGVELTAQRLQAHLAFAKQVLEQRDTFNAYLEETQQLESLCESIKNNIEQGTAGQDQVDDYAKCVQTFCLDDCSLPYPVRDYKHHDPRCRSLDENTNVVVAETFDAHHSRLKTLPDVLTSALKSKQLQTERQEAGDAYMTEAQNVEEWINTKLESLDKILDDDDDKVTDLHTMKKRQKADKRRSAIATVDAAFAAMQTYNNTYNSLKLQARKLDDNDQVHQRQDQIDQLWQKLSSSTGIETKEKLKEQLRQAEFKQSVSEFEDQCAQLRNQMDTVDLSILSDDQVAEWREHAQALKSQYLEKLGTSHRQEDEKTQYDQIVLDQQNLMHSLQDLDKKLHKYRLVTDYDKRTNDLTEFMHTMTDDLDTMRDKYGFIGGNNSDDEIKRQAFIDAYDDAHQRLQEHLEQLEVQRSSFRSLQIQDAVTDDIRARQSKFEEDYHTLESAAEKAKLAKEQFFQWRDLHTKLHLIQESAVVDDDEDVEQGKEKLIALESKLSLAMTMADRLVSNNKEDLQQLANKEKFMQHHEAVINKVGEAKAALDIKEQEVRERESLEACRTATTLINDRCRREIAAIKSRIRSAGDRCAELFEDIHSIEKHYRRASIGSASSQIGVYDELTDKLNHVEANTTNDAERLLVAETRDHLRSLNNAITSEQRWNDMVRRALGHAKTAENITSWVSNCKNAIDDISSNMDMTSDKDMETEIRDIQQRMADFSTIIESFKGMTQGIVQVNSTGSNEDELPSAIESLKTHVIRPCAECIDAEWQALQGQMTSLEDSMAKASKGVAVVRQMKRVLKVCSDTRGRLELLESDPSRVTLSSAHKQHHRPLSGVLREQDVLAIEQALNTIETEGQDQAKRELEKLDTMIIDFGDAEGAFAQQRSEMEAALNNMTTALNDKRHNLSKALEVGKCLMITDDIDVLVDALEDAVEKAKTATMTSRNTGSPATNKADMQGKYIELDARYKYYERKITQSLEAAKLATDDISDQKDREMIVEHIGELRKRWEQVDQQAKMQRSELSKALAAGQHINRGRKSSLPTRKASNFLRERERSPSRLPAPTTSNHGSGNTSSPLLAATSRLLPSTSLPRPTPRNTTTSTSKLTPPSIRRPPPPSKSAGSPKKPPAPPANTYVADPKNDLDMEIGRIVNETPYRVKVKMVPGEVGRYWFGDANPKLAYCRVLKSKMVMVRVGGGWMELSQFLRGHALLEGDFIPKTVEPDHPVLPVQEGFIETRRRQPHIRSRSPSSSSSLAGANKNNTINNNNSSISSNNMSNSLLPLPPSASISGSRSTPQKSLSSQTGYMDGDRYIAVDRYGNQLEVKMRKMTESTSGNTRMKSRQ